MGSSITHVYSGVNGKFKDLRVGGLVEALIDYCLLPSSIASYRIWELHLRLETFLDHLCLQNLHVIKKVWSNTAKTARVSDVSHFVITDS